MEAQKRKKATPNIDSALQFELNVKLRPALLNMKLKSPTNCSTPINSTDTNNVIRAGISAFKADFLTFIGQFAAEIVIFAPNDPK